MTDQSPPRRYRLPADAQTVSQPGSRGKVTLNLPGITSKRAMDMAEYEALLSAQQRWLDRITDETPFTARLICEMHRDWLGGICPWAGEYRTVNLTKGGFTWPPAIRVPENMLALEAGLLREHTPCRPGAIREVADRLAVVHADFCSCIPSAKVTDESPAGLRN